MCRCSATGQWHSATPSHQVLRLLLAFKRCTEPRSTFFLYLLTKRLYECTNKQMDRNAPSTKSQSCKAIVDPQRHVCCYNASGVAIVNYSPHTAKKVHSLLSAPFKLTFKECVNQQRTGCALCTDSKVRCLQSVMQSCWRSAALRPAYLLQYFFSLFQWHPSSFLHCP